MTIVRPALVGFWIEWRSWTTKMTPRKRKHYQEEDKHPSSHSLTVDFYPFVLVPFSHTDNSMNHPFSCFKSMAEVFTKRHPMAQ